MFTPLCVNVTVHTNANLILANYGEVIKNVDVGGMDGRHTIQNVTKNAILKLEKKIRPTNRPARCLIVVLFFLRRARLRAENILICVLSVGGTNDSFKLK